jgi:DNA-binding NtrC family response regulator
MDRTSKNEVCDLHTSATPRSAEHHGLSTTGQPFNELARRAARSDCTLLITGETGVGKGHLARWLHACSRRAEAPFVPVNCGAIPDSLIDSQLFGHVRGSFSGATSDHIGLVRAADKGTLFLDEIGELPLSAQLRLLRLLQDREVQPVGHPRPVIVNVRVFAATNGDLHDAVRRKMFREDLLYRIDVVRLHVKPMRQRRNEIAELLSEFNREFAALYDQPELALTAEAQRLLVSYDWPGNIRQLRTVLERLHVLCPEETIDAAKLIAIGQLNSRPGAPEPTRTIDDARFEEVLRVLADHNGSVSRAAVTLGVHRSTIYRWLQRRNAKACDTPNAR